MMNKIKMIIEQLDELEKTILECINSGISEYDKYSNFTNFAQSYELIAKEIADTFPDQAKDFTYLQIDPKAFSITVRPVQQKNAIFTMLSSIRDNKIKLKNLNEEYKDSNIKSRKPKIFISHSSNDSEVAKSLINLLKSIGLKSDDIFCSSISPYWVPLGNNIYEELRDQFLNFDLHVIFLISSNYYNSVASQNEVGAAWVLKNKSTSILLPGFEFNDIKGVIDKLRIGIKIDNEDCKYRLNELKNELIKEFNLNDIDDSVWEEARDSFIENVNKVYQSNIKNTGIKTTIELNDVAKDLIFELSKSSDGIIEYYTDITGSHVYVNNKTLFENAKGKEKAELKEAFIQLHKIFGLIDIEIDTLTCTRYSLTTKGYDYIEKI